jgi:lipopolysaccharide biosynthesis glycosyltransferase
MRLNKKIKKEKEEMIKNTTNTFLYNTEFNNIKCETIPEIWITIDKNLERYVDHIYNSIIKNSGKINFNIIHDNSVNKNLLNKYRNKGYILHNVETKTSSLLNYEFNRLSKGMFYRWYIPDFSNSDKAIYLDIDVIITGNIKELWNIDLKDNYIAAVREFYRDNIYESWSKHSKNNNNLPEEYKNIKSYFSGQLVINCKKWRNDKIKDKLLNFSNTNKCCDMMATSYIFKNKILDLDNEWCVPGFNTFNKGKAEGNMTELIRNNNFKYPKLIHWYGPDKPWRYKIKYFANFLNLYKGYKMETNDYDNYVLLGSAPHVKDYWEQNKKYYLQNGYKVLAINNAWYIDTKNLTEWFHPDDFWKLGTHIPNENDLKQFKETPMPRSRVEGYKDNNKGRGTMLLNVIYIMHNRYNKLNKKLNLVVIGSDFQYSKDKQFFYGKTKKQNPVVQKLLDKNNNHLVGINADPLRFGTNWIMNELYNAKEMYHSNGFQIQVDTPLEKTLLPFKHIEK